MLSSSLVPMPSGLQIQSFQTLTGYRRKGESEVRRVILQVLFLTAKLELVSFDQRSLLLCRHPTLKNAFSPDSVATSSSPLPSMKVLVK